MGISSKDASIRNFGFLVSKKPYIYTIDDDCLPAKDKYGNIVNPMHHISKISWHLQILISSTRCMILLPQILILSVVTPTV
mmetsp:Transcript_5029/g.12617  ORF Transcript_5029/g.12617 Transcript_5029/m.12617 type:complete len:81 (-) Transcript_5029:2371-2613(-)